VAAAVEGKIGDVDVAERREEERVMDADMVGDDALHLWNDRSADNRCDEDAGAVAGPRPSRV
jgi:hypothetical protein